MRCDCIFFLLEHRRGIPAKREGAQGLVSQETGQGLTTLLFAYFSTFYLRI